MLAILRYWQVGVGAALGGVLMLTYSTLVLQPHARQEGRAEERASALARTMEIISKRSETDAAVRSMSDAEICIALGGRWVLSDNLCR